MKLYMCVCVYVCITIYFSLIQFNLIEFNLYLIQFNFNLI